MKNAMQFVFILSVCVLLSNLCGCIKKDPNKKTAKTVEREVDVQKNNIIDESCESIKETADININDLDELEQLI